MAFKDVESKLRGQSWKKQLSLAFAALVVVGTCVAVRYFYGSVLASAQSPLRRGGQAGSTKSPRSTPKSARGEKRAARSDSSGSPSASQDQQNIVAVVDRQPITRDQLARECLRRHGEDVLESVTNRYLILQACQQKGIRITEQEVDNEIVRLAGKFGLPPDRWLQMLQDERDIRPEQYRRDIVWPLIALRRLAANEISVSQEELHKAMESEYGPKVRVRMISASDREKADLLRAEAHENPANFGNLAKSKSEDVNSAAARGLIPPIRPHVGDAQIEQTVFALKEGEISDVVEAAGQFFVFKCEKHIPATPIADHERKRISRQLADRIRDRKLRTAASDLFKSLQANARIVNVFNDPAQRESMPHVAATINGKTISMQYLAEQCLARFGNEVLDGEINRKVLQLALRRSGKSVTEEDIDREIDQTAERHAYVKMDGTPDRQALLSRVTSEQNVSVELYVRDVVWPTAALQKLVEEQVQVTDEDLQKGFIANYGERVRVLAIVVGNRHTANEVWQMAKNNPKSEKFFGELANQYSIEPVSRANYGEVPPIGRYGGQQLLEEEAFSLGPGNELSGVLAMADKFIILRYLGRTKPVVNDLDAVRPELVKDIREKKLRAAMSRKFDELRQRSQIDNFLAGTTQNPRRAQAARVSHEVPVTVASPPRRATAK